MKIWKAELYLNCDMENKWNTHFNFELQDEDYEENKKFNEWICFKNWVVHKIPMYIQVENSGYSGLKVVQGFNHKLTEDELKVLEAKMREALKEHLEYEKENYMKTYLNKINNLTR